MDIFWRTRSSRTVLRDNWIDVRADECITPSGKEVSPYYVLSYPDWVHVMALTPDRKIVLVRQYRHAIGATVLELPGGGVDVSDVNLEMAARRELAEETGFSSETWLKVSTLYPNPATHSNRVHAYLALDAVQRSTPSLDHSEEGLAACLMPLDQVLEALGQGILGQSMHVATVMLANKLLEQR